MTNTFHPRALALAETMLAAATPMGSGMQNLMTEALQTLPVLSDTTQAEIALAESLLAQTNALIADLPVTDSAHPWLCDARNVLERRLRWTAHVMATRAAYPTNNYPDGIAR